MIPSHPRPLDKTVATAAATAKREKQKHVGNWGQRDSLGAGISGGGEIMTTAPLSSPHTPGSNPHPALSDSLSLGGPLRVLTLGVFWPSIWILAHCKALKLFFSSVE